MFHFSAAAFYTFLEGHVFDVSCNNLLSEKKKSSLRVTQVVSLIKCQNVPLTKQHLHLFPLKDI